MRETEGVISIALMASYLRRLVFLMVFGLVQQSRADIKELKSANSGPLNELSVNGRYTAIGDQILRSKLQHQVEERQSSHDLPHVYGEHMFDDGYGQGRIHYSGNHSDVIFVLTYDLRNSIPYRSNLYRSTNYGSSFTNINNLVDDSVLYHTFSSSHVNRELLLLVHATEARLYYTLDEGVTFIRRDLSPDTLNPRSIELHPTHDDWMMTVDSDNSLYVTVDYAATWKQVAFNVAIFQWADEKWDDNSEMLYYMTRDPAKADLTVNLFTSAYPFTDVAEFDSNLGGLDVFLLVGPYIYAQHTNDDVIGLYVSYKRQPFQKTIIPTPYAQQSYLVTHINELQALVIVEHEGGFYNLYMSDETGVYFSLSLRDIVFENFTSRFDLELIHGVNATMIANQYAREDVTQSDSLKRTLITFHNGARWEPVLPPNEDVDGASIICDLPDCSLHFHMDTSNYTRLGVYSTDSAPGIVVAQGNTGAGVSSSPNLYLSRDGGVSWEETLSGSWRVSVADHGGLMVAVRDYHQDMSTELMYTCDEGYNWQTFTFIDTPITVYDMVTEPGEHTTIVSLYGGERGSDSFMWVVVTVEFVPIFQRACNDNDFYDWMPWEESERDCTLGSTVTIERREPQVCCLNGRDYVREVNFTICQCNSEDFECDYGYAWASTDSTGSCIRDEDVSLPDPCADGKIDTYNASTGYRKIAGDVCQGGVEFLYSPFIAPCDENSTLPPTLQDPTDATLTSSTHTITSSTSSTHTITSSTPTITSSTSTITSSTSSIHTITFPTSSTHTITSSTSKSVPILSVDPTDITPTASTSTIPTLNVFTSATHTSSISTIPTLISSTSTIPTPTSLLTTPIPISSISSTSSTSTTHTLTSSTSTTLTLTSSTSTTLTLTSSTSTTHTLTSSTSFTSTIPTLTSLSTTPIPISSTSFTSSTSATPTSSTSAPMPSVEINDTPNEILTPVFIALSVVFGLASIAVLTLCIVVGIRRSYLRRSYTSIASTGETEQQRYTVTPTDDIEMEKSVEDVTPDSEDPDHEDDNALPLAT